MKKSMYATLQEKEGLVDRDLDMIDKYVELYIDLWGCKFDYEDGSTAPFSTLAIEEVENGTQF